MAVEQPQPSEPSVDPAARPAGARAPRPVEHPDTVADAAATPERAMPHRELGLKDEEYASIKELLGLGENLRLHSVVAFGYPTHKSHLVAMQNGNVKYYLDDARDYCVPKRPMEEILLKTL